MTTLISNREVFIEFHTIGQFVKVTAMDTATMTEISIQGSASSSETTLKTAALRRLEYVLKKNGVIE
ncbi:MAG: hypothetical protein A3J37_04135 [Alphaproteobacteria bacterium RIFCSPHIGHO2_12_FULL_45_9]|nr:MAG: hypothetical protein A3B66_07815 [Alphaproteobacteria bacterium RIFCSPHIGHO2_02_FULL_46_13]OFW95387.1 MAG: hypothetical protein A3J37_04135 [Alphaproteobacteria bacterium RIFCSPHIGHO2_12_FULL_45_9]